MCEPDSNKTGVKLHARQFQLVSFCSYQYQAMTPDSAPRSKHAYQFSPRLRFLTLLGGIQTFIQTFWTQTCEKKTIELTPCSTQPIDKVDFFTTPFICSKRLFVAQHNTIVAMDFLIAT